MTHRSVRTHQKFAHEAQHVRGFTQACRERRPPRCSALQQGGFCDRLRPFKVAAFAAAVGSTHSSHNRVCGQMTLLHNGRPSRGIGIDRKALPTRRRTVVVDVLALPRFVALPEQHDVWRIQCSVRRLPRLAFRDRPFADATVAHGARFGRVEGARSSLVRILQKRWLGTALLDNDTLVVRKCIRRYI